jgi:diguanylate cyclase (GGDEF)-like protein
MEINNNVTGRPKILIVDDKPANLFALEIVLGELDIDIVRANSGQEALAKVIRNQFFVALLDVKMPHMDGFETASIMQGHDKVMQIPIIFITGHSVDELAKIEGYAVGAADYITKPFNPDTLLIKVKMFLQLYNQNKELQREYKETIALELNLKNKNLELEANNTILEESNKERHLQYEQIIQLLDMNPNGILIIDKNNIILVANPAAITLIDVVSVQLIGEFFDYIIELNKNREIKIGNGNIVDMSAVSITWAGDDASLVTLHDVTERKLVEARLLQLAQYDQLTGLANRRHCIEFVDKALARARRQKGYVAVLFLDLDKFKDINDSLGHAVGDILLKSVAQRLLDNIREGDLAARFGGDEFALVLDAISDPDDALHVAQKILESMIPPHILANNPIQVSCSIGISTFPDCGFEAEALFKSADIAMFCAKERRENSCQIFTKKMQKQLDERMWIEQDLRHAVERNELVLHYQPLVDITSGWVVSVEALLRWQHPENGLISPDQFIPVAERTNLIVDIGEWVLQTACQQANLWNNKIQQGGQRPPLTIAVNVSAKQLSNGDFTKRLKRVLKKTNVNPSCIDIELTESAMMTDLGSAFTELEGMHCEGLTISVDDFGTGYSSLSYLQLLPLNALKIDQSFTANIGKNRQSEIIVKTIIGMAHSLGLRVVGEGVETAEQARFLKDNKCDLMQGYYFSRPLPFAEITSLLENGLTALCNFR